MRLLRLRIGDFGEGHELKLDLGSASVTDAALAFLVGPNGTGKSRVLEILGRIFSHLSAGVAPGLDFELEYELGEQRVLISSRRPKLERGNAGERIERVDAWLLVAPAQDFDGWRAKHRRSEWPAGAKLDTILPYRVVGLSTGPASRLDSALRGSVIDTLSQRLDTSADEAPPDVPREEFEAFRESEREALRRELQAVSNEDARSIALSGEELSLAMLALLCHPGAIEPQDEIRDEILRRVGLRAEDSLCAFSLEVVGSWQNLILAHEHQVFEELLNQASRRIALIGRQLPEEEEPPEADQRAIFEVSASLRGWLAESSESPFIWFGQMLRWLKAGAIRTVRLVLKKQGSDDLLLDSDFSDGELLLAGRYGLLLLLREHRNCLVLFDEPETHFNDRWKIDLVRDLVRILDGRAAQVVIATHSDITLSDADHAAVHLLERNGAQPSRSTVQPPVSPFGADRATITTSVFGASSGSGSYAIEIVDEALGSKDRERIEAALERVGPGFHQFRLEYALRTLGEDAG
ncbi:MAG TPA: AAA family ATPase [Solirubrobacterales bacterium]|nr:AAA family ATPase [Solirubrobacterales bacterium]